MTNKITIVSLILLAFIACGSFLAADASRKPLTKAEVLALVSGVIVPENVAYDIRSRGIAFVPHKNFHRLLQAAGANKAVFAALGSAKSHAPVKPEIDSDNTLYQHL